MYFDRILFSAVFATLLGTAALALLPAETTIAQTANSAVVTAEQRAVPSLEPVVVIGNKEDASRI